MCRAIPAFSLLPTSDGRTGDAVAAAVVVNRTPVFGDGVLVGDDHVVLHVLVDGGHDRDEVLVHLRICWLLPSSGTQSHSDFKKRRIKQLRPSRAMAIPSRVYSSRPSNGFTRPG